MGVQDGQAVNAAVTNPAFINKNVDDTTPSKLGLADTDPLSGGAIINTQREFNAIDQFIGNSPNLPLPVVPMWTNQDVGATGDSLFLRADALTERFNQTTGHNHDGTDGSGQILIRSLNSLGNPQLFGDVTLVPGTSISLSQVGQTITIATIPSSGGASGGGSEVAYFAAWTMVVGSSGQVASGAATHTSLTSAIAAAVAGNTIKILQVTVVENVTVDKQLFIEGSGYASYINGSITYNSSSSYSILEKVRFNDNITLQTGANGIQIDKVYLPAGKTFLDSGIGNLVEGIVG